MNFKMTPTTCIQYFLILGVSFFSHSVYAAPAPKTAQKIIPSPKAKPLHVAGRVLTMEGKPLAGVEIGIYGTTARGDRTRFETRTNASGLYSQRVPDGFYGLSAYFATKYNGKNYKFTLHPEDGKTGVTHDAARGVIKNFRWKISGLKPGETAGEEGAYGESNKYYGGYVYLTSRETGTLNTPIYFPKGSSVVITMAPRGKLIDGSTGTAKTFRRRFDRDMTSGITWYLNNLPIGLYNFTAAYFSPTGQRMPLKAKRSLDFNGDFKNVVPVDFEPTAYGDMQMMQVTINSPVSE
jgi:hypothetical protein